MKEGYQWKNRLLLVFAPSQKNLAYQTQMQLFEGQKAGFKDRDLLLVQILADGSSSVDDQRLNHTSAVSLRECFDVGTEEFGAILVGKDGTEKRRDHAPVQPTVIFGEIDAMPMRQQEMSSRSNS